MMRSRSLLDLIILTLIAVFLLWIWLPWRIQLIHMLLMVVVRSGSARAKVQRREANRRWLRGQGNPNQHRVIPHGKDPAARNSEVERDSEERATARESKELPRAVQIRPWRTWATVPVGTVTPPVRKEVPPEQRARW
ncbi:hypothetical protein DMENIID0001_057200 [Sergentomyia squamirostris]